MRASLPTILQHKKGDDPSVVYVDFAQKTAIMLGRICAVAALIVIMVWALRTGNDEKYLGGLSWYDDRVINYHVVFMPLGLVFFSGWSITAYRNAWFSPTMNRTWHVSFHLATKICMTIGLIAVQQYKDDPKKNNSSTGYEAHLYSIHSWMGVLTSIFLFQNDIIGVFIFLFPKVSKRVRSYYSPEHKFLGKFAFILACATVVTGTSPWFNLIKDVYGVYYCLQLGIVELTTLYECNYEVNKAETNPPDHYLDIPVGCRLAGGGAVLVMLTLFFILYGLECRGSPKIILSPISSTCSNHDPSFNLSLPNLHADDNENSAVNNSDDSRNDDNDTELVVMNSKEVNDSSVMSSLHTNE